MSVIFRRCSSFLLGSEHTPSPRISQHSPPYPAVILSTPELLFDPPREDRLDEGPDHQPRERNDDRHEEDDDGAPDELAVTFKKDSGYGSQGVLKVDKVCSIIHSHENKLDFLECCHLQVRLSTNIPEPNSSPGGEMREGESGLTDFPLVEPHSDRNEALDNLDLNKPVKNLNEFYEYLQTREEDDSLQQGEPR